MRLVPVVVLLAACSDYELNRAPDRGDGPGDDTDTGTNGDGDTDGDDTDTNTDDCEAEAAAATDVELVEECEGYDGGTVTDPWNLNVEWKFDAAGASVVMPAVGNLTDDDGDGDVDEDDTPDVAIAIYSGAGMNKVYALSGDGSGEIWNATGFRYDGGVIIADVDADGRNDVVGPTSNGRIQAVRGGNGNAKWTSAATFSMMYPVTTAADLDADGTIEVIADVGVVNGEDGSTYATLNMGSSSCWRTPVAADLDDDGFTEIILGPHVFDYRGTRLWTASGSGTSCFAAVADADVDPEAELFFAYGPELIMYEHDGTLIDAVDLPGNYGHPGPPCVGDLDGDGESEIAVPSGTYLTAYELDGTQMWSRMMSDSSGAGGCSVYDMNGDGTYEVLFADEQDLRFYDGPTGTVLYTNGDHASVTYFEYPVVADIDHDGSAEIAVSASGYYGGQVGVTVFGHAGSGWPKAGPTWGIHDYAATNQDPSGAIPTLPTPSWQTYNVFRGRPSEDIPATPDLTVDLTDLCVTTCEGGGEVQIAYQVGNQGAVDVAAGTVIGLYLVDAGVETFYDSQTLGAVNSGRAPAGGIFVVPLADMGDGGFVLRVDDDGTGVDVVVECDETNNELIYTESFCG